jgi:nuclear receptor subfamily 1 group F protein 4
MTRWRQYDIAILILILTAVKFGRMSKKQREKVEDEVRFHRAQLRAQTETAPDSSVFDTQTPSSSDQLQPNYNGG